LIFILRQRVRLAWTGARSRLLHYPLIRKSMTGGRSAMDLRLTEEQLEFKKIARDFLEAEVVPNRQQWDRDEAVDPAIAEKMGEIGFFGITIPEEYGGLGGDWVTYCIGMEELGRADSAVRGIVSVSAGLVGKTILAHGSEEQKRRWLPGIASGTVIGCFGLTEPDYGSDPAHLKTRARRDGDEWVISGSKIFITNATIADVALVFARTGTGPGQDGARGVSAFLVPTDARGFGRTLIHGKLGLRGQATAELSFRDVRVPADALLGKPGGGFRYAMESLDKGRISVAAGCTGIIQACLEAATGYAVTRHQFGKPIAAYQLVQDMIAQISVDADAARLLTWRAADLVQHGEPFGTAASKAKLFASEAAVKAANLAIQVYGGYGYVDEYPVQKLMRDARVMTLYEGTSQIQKLLIGRAETGVSAF
jgi:alkylation response protein AidB-like acyl-CoA dehydrogenase